jgi:PAS domain S-box-containing protein
MVRVRAWDFCSSVMNKAKFATVRMRRGNGRRRRNGANGARDKWADGEKRPVISAQQAASVARKESKRAIDRSYETIEHKAVDENLAVNLEAIAALHELGQHCTRVENDFENCLRKIVEIAIAISGAEKANLQLLDKKSGALIIAAQHGFEKPFLQFFASVTRKENSACATSMKSARHTIVPDVTKSEIFTRRRSLRVLLEAGVRAVHSTPLLSSVGGLIGMLSIHFPKPHRASKHELRFMDLLARQAADYIERKRGEAAAMRLVAVVRSSHDAIVAKDLNGIITDWNRSAERIFGYKAKEIIGKSILTLVPQEREGEEEEILRKIRRGQSIDHHETVRRRKDGHLIDVSLTISPIKDPKGEIVGVFKVARDITKQKQAERLLAEQARLLDLSNEAILVRDFDDRITYWNHGATELYGYSAEEALGKITHRLLRTEHPEPLTQIHKKLERDDRWSGELVHRRKDGSKIVVMSHWAVDRDESGRRAYVLETNSDITAPKRAELALERSRQMLERLVQQRTKALRLANGELQTEITRRKGLEGQILEVSDREQQRLGQELHDGLCQQLTAIGFLAHATALRLKDRHVVQAEDLEKIAQLINGSVMDARNIARDLHKEEVEAAEFEQALQDLIDRKIWQTQCRLDLKTKIDIEDDNVASQLYRILREAVVNANKHARATEVTLEARRSEGRLIFSVRDNGVGLNTNAKPAHGLGFHIMKYRAESIGARLEVESLKKGGARVTVYLPNGK